MQVREQHQDERGERDEVDQDVCERRDEENELGRDGGDENECVQGCAHLWGEILKRLVGGTNHRDLVSEPIGRHLVLARGACMTAA